MGKTLRSIALALMAVLGSAAVARADMCLALGAIKGLFVGQNFARPGRGTCKPFLGNHGTSPLGGVACMTTAGDLLQLGFTSYGLGGTIRYRVDLPLPSLTGGDWAKEIGTSVAQENGTASVVQCFPANQTIP